MCQVNIEMISKLCSSKQEIKRKSICTDLSAGLPEEPDIKTFGDSRTQTVIQDG